MPNKTTSLTDTPRSKEFKNLSQISRAPLLRSRPLQAAEIEIKDYYRVEEATTLLGVCAQTIYRWDKAGSIQCFRTLGGQRRIPRSEILRIQFLRTTGGNSRAPTGGPTDDEAITPLPPLSQDTSARDAAPPRSDTTTEQAPLEEEKEGPQGLGAIKNQLKSLRILLTSPLVRPLLGSILTWLNQISGQLIDRYEELMPLKTSWAQFQAALQSFNVGAHQRLQWQAGEQRQPPTLTKDQKTSDPVRQQQAPRTSRALLQARSQATNVFWELVRAQNDSQQDTEQRARAKKLVANILEPYQRVTRYLAHYPPGTLAHDVCRLLLCHRPRDFKLLRRTWSIRSLAEVCQRFLHTTAASRSQVQRFLKQLKWYNKPQRRLVSPDPLFGEKMKQLGKTFAQLAPQDLVLFGDASKITSRKVEEHIQAAYVSQGFEIPLKTSIKRFFKSTWIMTVFGLYAPTLPRLDLVELPKEDYNTFFPRLTTLLKRFISTIPGTIYLILDNAPYHRPNHLPSALQNVFGEKVQVLFLPTHSPELNPIEAVWHQSLKAFDPGMMTLTGLRNDFQRLLRQIQQTLRTQPAKPLKLHCSVCGHTFRFTPSNQKTLGKQVEAHLCFTIPHLNPYVIQVLSQALEGSPVSQ